MADPACGSAARGDVRQAIAEAARACADAVAALAAAGAGRRGEKAVRDAVRELRRLAFDEELIEAAAARRADEILAEAGLVPQVRRRHLRAVP